MKKQITNLCLLFFAVLALLSVNILHAEPRTKAPFIIATGETTPSSPTGQLPFYISKDSIEWSSYYLPSIDRFSRVNVVLWANDKYLAILHTGNPFISQGAYAITSTDGIHWSTKYPASLPNQSINHVIWAKNQYVAVGDDNGSSLITTSPDGIHWTPTDAPKAGILKRVIWANNQFVAVGGASSIMTSPDGKKWTLQNSTLPYTYLKGIAWGNNMYVVTYDGDSFDRYGTYVITSPDGKNWTKRIINPVTARTDRLTSITWGNNQFVAISWHPFDKGNVYTSPNGIDWAKHPGFYNFDRSCLIWLDNQYIVASSPSAIRTSPNGIDWTTRHSKIIGDDLLSITG